MPAVGSSELQYWMVERVHPPTARLAGGAEVDIRRGADGMQAFITRADDCLMAEVACRAMLFTRDLKAGERGRGRWTVRYLLGSPLWRRCGRRSELGGLLLSCGSRRGRVCGRGMRHISASEIGCPIGIGNRYETHISCSREPQTAFITGLIVRFRQVVRQVVIGYLQGNGQDENLA